MAPLAEKGLQQHRFLNRKSINPNSSSTFFHSKLLCICLVSAITGIKIKLLEVYSVKNAINAIISLKAQHRRSNYSFLLKGCCHGRISVLTKKTMGRNISEIGYSACRLILLVLPTEVKL